MIPKFRAFHTINKKMMPIIIIDFRYEILVTSPANWVASSFKREECELMQSTGLFDKNGVEIYEGDIIKIDGGAIYEVKFGEYLTLWKYRHNNSTISGYGFYLKIIMYVGMYDEKELDIDILYTFEVIGNIYENKELLEIKL